LAVSICPSRLLAEATWAEEFLEWWVWSVKWDGMTGQPSGTPEWPFPGGLLRQPKRLVDACKILRAEWPYVQRPGVRKPQERTEPTPEPPQRPGV
jgi:hypothetical protein